jgi:SNF2 family DNA or RNA helicase
MKRAGQTRSTRVVRLLARGTIEEDIVELQAQRLAAVQEPEEGAGRQEDVGVLHDLLQQHLGR